MAETLAPPAEGDNTTSAGALAWSLKRGLIWVGVFNLLLLCVLVSTGVPHHLRVVTDSLAQCVGALAVVFYSLAGFRQASGGQRGRWSSLFLGLGVLGYAFGQAISTSSELALGHPTPFPSWADAGYLAAYPFLFLGVLMLPAQQIPTASRLRALFDSLMLIVALVAFSWYYVLGPTITQSGEGALAQSIGSAYPMCDMVLLTCVILLFVRARESQLRSLAILLSAALCGIIASDTVFDYQTLHNTYAVGHPIDIGSGLGYMLVGLAARKARQLPTEQLAKPQPQERTLPTALEITGWLRYLVGCAPAFLPYAVVPAAGALVWHEIRTPGDENLKGGVFFCAGILFLLILARQFLMVIENQQLALQLRGFNEKLEGEVIERTAELSERTTELHGRTEQLAALHHLTVAINETLVLEQVVSSTVWHLRQVLQADAAVMWIAQTEAATVSYPPIARHAGMEDKQRLLCYLADIKSADDVLECRVPDTLLPAMTVKADGAGAFYLQVAIRWQGLSLGRIGVVRLDRSFSQTDKDLLQSVGLQVATALENARQFCAACEAADRDPITGLWNHRSINQYLTVALDVAGSQEEPLTIIMTDLDNFKLLNNTYGHPAGDQVLQRISQILTEECSGADRVGRYGGDEFLIVLSPGKTEEDGIAMAQRLRDRVLTETFQYSQDERTIPLGLSFGVACFPRDSQDRQDLLRTADANMSVAKSSDEHVATLSDMQRSHRELRSDSSFRILDSLVTSVDNKDHYTRRHSEDVTTYSLWIAEEAGLREDALRLLRVGGLLHDVGKIGVPDEILRKPGKLTAEEYDALKQHCALGAYIVAGIPGMDGIVDIVRHHHERWDGKGYPNQLAAENIPMLARIVAVADAVSAMTTDRPYRKGLDWQVCLAEVARCSESQFDPQFAAAFLRAAARRLNLTTAPARQLPKAA